MQEEFLHYIWNTRFEKKTLISLQGEKVVIVKTGEQNHDAGPDFMNAMVSIDGTTWAGSVEIHIRASDWCRHGHDQDQSYDNVILHVVYEYDGPVFRTSGEEIPAIEIREHIPQKAYKAYLDFLNNHLWVPCANEIQQLDGPAYEPFLEKLCRERIVSRSQQIMQLIHDSKGDWNQAFFISLAGTLGTRINKAPFEMLARKTPMQVLLKSRSSLNTLEALLFGQAGFLEYPYKDPYPARLTREYLHLKHKYSLEGIPVYLWKFLRLRPVNFPTVRIAQLSALYYHHPLLFGMIMDEDDPLKWHDWFDIEVNEYWKNHYHFDKLSLDKEKHIGQEMTELILINTVIPFLYSFGKLHGNADSSEKAFDYLRLLPSENNSIILKYNYFGLECCNAMHSQGALELKKNWCDQRKCLDCFIGQELLKRAY